MFNVVRYYRSLVWFLNLCQLGDQSETWFAGAGAVLHSVQQATLYVVQLTLQQ